MIVWPASASAQTDSTTPTTNFPALLARLQQDTGPCLTPEQVAALAQPRYRGQPPTSNPAVSMMRQFVQNLRSLFNGSS